MRRAERQDPDPAGPGGDALTVTGVDGCPGGWVAVTLGLPGPAATGSAPEHAQGARIAVSAIISHAVAATLDALPLAGVTGIDMPLGLLAAGWRDADLLARLALGRRGVTVFAIPPRSVWECETYAEASRACRDLTGKGFSVQAWGLRRKVAEADAFRRRTAASGHGISLYEVHPELSFMALAGVPLSESKHTPAGLAIRRRLLAEAGITVAPKVARVPENDLLDAAAVAWSARRIATGAATVIASSSQRADDGTEIAIRYLPAPI